MRIVSIAWEVPYPGIAHAGGEHLRRHLQLLVDEGHEVLLLAAASWKARQALDRGGRDQAWAVHLVAAREPGAGLRGRVQRLAVRLLPVLRERGFHDALLEDPTAQAAIAAADVVELQWFQEALLAPRLRRRWPRAAVIAVFHDVVSQALWRDLAGRARTPRPLLAAARWALTWLLERRVLAHVDVAVVFSTKDARLLRRRRRGVRVAVLAPPLDVPDMSAGPGRTRPSRPTALFVGAFFRPENDDAARWLVSDVWPEVLQRVPAAQLVLAGDGPSEALRTLAADAGVEVTGYVDDLAPLYRSATVVVSPLRSGAGVKFKNVVALLWGLPVVTTRIGAEGIDGPGVFLAVDDTARGLAAGVVHAMLGDAAAAHSGARGLAWAGARYTGAVYASDLRELLHRVRPSIRSSPT